ncbi:hypothetical protein N752_10580 [Desulforamulus aquiferis]|nr:hypothetical protein N752_10580 [Desulforamulus aquiferis]
MKMSGAQVLIDALKEMEVEHIFGYPGGQVLPSTMPFMMRT